MNPIYLLSPEITLVVAAAVVIMADLFLKDDNALIGLSLLGIVVAGFFAFSLWGVNTRTLSDLLLVDPFSVFFKLLFLAIAALVILASKDYASKMTGFMGEYYALVMLSTVGLMLMAATGDLISVYIALETASISLYALAGFLKDKKSSEAGLKYLLLGGVSSAVLLYGMALVFGLTGTTNLSEIAKSAGLAGGLAGNPALLLGVIFLVAGFGFKIAAVPFQMWVPDVYEGAPTPVTAFLSVASKAAGFAVILRVFFTAFDTPQALAVEWSAIFAALSAVSMTIGNVVAIPQSNIKRMLAYSSIAQAGYVMVGLASVSALGQSGVAFFLASYALTNLGAFIAVIAITNKIGSDLIADFSGMARRAPLVAAALTFCLVSLTGIPVTAGFISKVYIFNAGVQAQLGWLVVLGVINSVISAYYYLRVVKVMYVGAPASEEPVPSSSALRTALALSSLGVLLLGVLPGPFLRLAETAVSVLPR
ncbi:MAG: NADH-quinone oxidoreductase subunit N [Chloroflexi bacterium]|nr:NADH-quinone oxidoreductase subunit N [Chloroflexota bacterium]